MSNRPAQDSVNKAAATLSKALLLEAIDLRARGGGHMRCQELEHLAARISTLGKEVESLRSGAISRRRA